MRHQILDMPHWEVWEYIKGIHRVNTIHQINIVTAGILSNPWYTMDDRDERIKALYVRTELYPEMNSNNSSQSMRFSSSKSISINEAIEKSKDPSAVISQIKSIASTLPKADENSKDKHFTAPCNDGKVQAPNYAWTFGSMDFARGGAGF